jgi:four helix bundle protein
MGTYRDLRAWQAADEVVKAAFALADRQWCPQHACVYDQLRRAALSVSLNIVEGHALGPGAGCRAHFRIALGSAVETIALIDLLTDLGIGTENLPEQAGRSRAMCFRLWQRSRTR